MKIENYVKMPEGSYEIAIFDAITDKGLSFQGMQLLRSKAGHLYVKSSSFRDKRIQGDKPYNQSVDLQTDAGKELAKKIMEAINLMQNESLPF